MLPGAQNSNRLQLYLLLCFSPFPSPVQSPSPPWSLCARAVRESLWPSLRGGDTEHPLCVLLAQLNKLQVRRGHWELCEKQAGLGMEPCTREPWSKDQRPTSPPSTAQEPTLVPLPEFSWWVRLWQWLISLVRDAPWGFQQAKVLMWLSGGVTENPPVWRDNIHRLRQ